ncbi:MAG TPA: hypothetical protein VFX16_12230 [Pseudonocardiaceae bacterium]|nr:hypothetical protein [Pseudonocardiaceae bacterium]
MAEQVIEHDTHAEVGPLAGFAAEAARLHTLYQQGRLEEVVAAVEAQRANLVDLPAAEQSTVPWTVREAILGVGVAAAHDLGHWEQALELNAGVRQSQEDRHAGDVEQAVTSFNDYAPLLRQGRGLEAKELLYRCRAVFAGAEDLTMMGNTLSALADTDSHLGHRASAIDQETDALRLKYQGSDPEAIAVSHYNLANYLIKAGQDLRAVWAHRLAAAVIRYQTNSSRFTTSLQSISRLVGHSGGVPVQAPLSFNDICSTVDSLAGVRFAELFGLLPDRIEGGQSTVDEIMKLTTDMRDAAIEESIAAWEPIISAMVATADKDANAEAGRLLDDALAELEKQHPWRELVFVLTRIQAGPDHHSEQTVDNLDPVSSAVARRARAALAGEVNVDPTAWQALTDEA